MPGRPAYPFGPLNNLPPPGCRCYVPAFDNVPEEMKRGPNNKLEEMLRLYKYLGSSVEAALRVLFNYEGTVKDLPSFTMERMSRAAPLVFTYEHGIDAGIHRQMKTYFEGHNLTLCAFMTPIADGYADMFSQI
ncbi:hypothetical protein MRB53_035071 [Persea americana]|uniref:Uncharacterized protein n=1 Tax=Persea americana TaxID=3435 RepID=A0ACC2K3J6_PERAE|nr:hypothetical protein MRB53_035071 [Persea americana]